MDNTVRALRADTAVLAAWCQAAGVAALPAASQTVADFIDATLVHTDESSIYARPPARGYQHKTVCHARGEYARDEDGDGFCEAHVNTMEGFWSLLRS